MSNAKIDHYWTPIMLVIRGRGKDDIEMLQLLIDKGVDVNIKTDTGETALMRTKKRRNIEMTKLLIKAGAK